MQFLKKLIPEPLLKIIRPIYHGLLAWLASIYYGSPSSKIIVIGITGTAGKSTTAAMLSHILNAAGRRTGYMTTVNFFDGYRDFINKHGLSMPGGPLLQKQLKQLVNGGCQYAIVECTSEGLSQNRHLGINFDVALFTNLSEAHIETHGSFKNYQTAKGKLFRALGESVLTADKKKINPLIQKIIGLNLDDEHANFFSEFDADFIFGVTFGSQSPSLVNKIYQAQKATYGFAIGEQKVEVKLPGEFNLYNALLAAACANVLGADLKICADALASFIGIRGRMEPVENNRGLKIYVDYGCEPATIKAALIAASAIPHRRLIHVFGATGGHRDKSKQFIFGETSARFADISIITNDDVYDSSPQEIADNTLAGFNSVPAGERKAKEALTLLDRRQAISQALALAQKNDLVLITGKGSEQFLVLPGNKRIEWDEVGVVKEELSKISAAS